MVEIGVGTCARKESSRTHSSLLGMASEIQSLTAAYFLPTLMRSRTGSSSNSLRLCERSPESYLAINNGSWNTVGHGRLIPLIIIDTTNRPDLTEAIEAQVHLPAGDVVVQWGSLPKRHDHIALLLKFQRPTERAAVIEFEIVKQGILVEHILQSNGLYIQAGKVGDRLKHDLNRPKMLIEVPDTGIRAQWDKLYFDAVVKRVRKDGLGRRDAKEIARAFIGQIRELAKFRMKSASRTE